MRKEQYSGEMFQSLLKGLQHDPGNASGPYGSAIMPELLSCDPKGLEALYRYSSDALLSNAAGSIHGGAVATWMDICQGNLIAWVNGGYPDPTISLQLSYMRPVIPGRPAFIRSKIQHVSGRLCFASSWLWQTEGETAATASGVFRVGVPLTVNI